MAIDDLRRVLRLLDEAQEILDWVVPNSDEEVMLYERLKKARRTATRALRARERARTVTRVG